MAAGLLRTRVAFEQQMRTPDGAGGFSVAWSTALTVWGYLRPERGRERLEAGRLESATMAVLRIRSSAAARAIDASYRAVVDGVHYQIRAIVNPDQRDEYIEMTLEEGVAQ